MDNNSNHQKKVPVLASLISVAIHTAIILVLNSVNQGDKANITKNKTPVKIQLVETRVTREITAEKHKPKAEQSTYRKLPKPITQSNPSRVAKQTVVEQQQGDGFSIRSAQLCQRQCHVLQRTHLRHEFISLVRLDLQELVGKVPFDHRNDVFEAMKHPLNIGDITR